MSFYRDPHDELVAKFVQAMEPRLAAQTKELKDAWKLDIERVDKRIDDLEERIRASATQTALEKAVQHVKEDFRGQLKTVLETMSSERGSPAVSTDDRTEWDQKGKDERFWAARRSLALSPVDPMGGDLESAARQFLVNSLRMSADDVKAMSVTAVASPTISVKGRRPKIPTVVVTFEDSRTRDAALAHAPNLTAEDRVSIVVPDFLQARRRKLENTAYYLRNDEATKGTKTFIRLNDEEFSLDLYCKAPGRTNWTKHVV